MTTAAAVWPHTRVHDPENGPPYCRECSERKQAWVPWPCPGTRLLSLSLLGRTPR